MSPTADDVGIDLEGLLQLLNAAPVGLVQFDGAGEIAFMTAATVRWLLPAITASSTGGMTNLFTALAPLAPQLAGRVAQFDRPVGSVLTGLALDVPDGSRQGVPRHLELSLDKLGDDRFIAVVVDVTATRHAEAEAAHRELRRLRQENRDMAEVSRLKSLFVANVSHEFRTPLNAVLGFAEFLKAGAVPAGSTQHAEFLAEIVAGARVLQRRIDDVIELSNLEAQRFEFQPQPVDLSTLVTAVVDGCREDLRARGLACQVDVDANLGEVLIDPTRFQQVVLSYVSNAIAFTPSGGAIHVAVRPEGPSHFRLEVRDTGVGIAPEALPALFTPFHQLDAGLTRTRGGTGLGLALTRRLVEAQGGTVGVCSERGRGSVFHAVIKRFPHSREG